MSERCTAWCVPAGMPTRFECKGEAGHIGMHNDCEYVSEEEAKERMGPSRTRPLAAWSFDWWDDIDDQFAFTTGYEGGSPRG